MSAIEEIDLIFAEIQSKYSEPGNDVPVHGVACPKCGKVGTIMVDELLLRKNPGTIRFPVIAGMVCDHYFMTSIDVHGVPR